MDLRSGCNLWIQLDGGGTRAFPRLDQDLRCDVAIIGCGITGAICAHLLTQAGAGVVVVDRREISHGSTAASTGLLQYEIDTPLTELIDLVGRDHAERAYRLSVRSLTDMKELVAGLEDSADLIERPSLYLAHESDEPKNLRQEHAARRAIGIDVEFLTSADLGRDFGIQRPAALWSRTAMEVDPYRLALALVRGAVGNGAKAFADTEITRYDADDRGVTLRTDRGPSIRTKKVIFATGYETPEFLDKDICTLKSTYAMASERISDFSSWRERCLIWESNTPYFYARTTADGRALVGGEDEDFSNPTQRDALIEAKSQILKAKLKFLLPDIDARIACVWAGTFAETKDGLPYIGTTRQFPHGYFALGYGGNGITFSLIAAQIIRDLFTGKPNPDAEIFRFDR